MRERGEGRGERGERRERDDNRNNLLINLSGMY
jgi:hypothetical protein